MQKYRESRYVVCADEDFMVNKNADGTYELMSPTVGADGAGLRTDLSQKMSAMQVIKLGRLIHNIEQDIMEDLIHQREDLERTLHFLQQTENGNGNGRTTRR